MAKADLVKLRVTDQEKQGFENAAAFAGLTLSAWARERLRRAARRELDDAGLQVPFLQHVRLD